MVQNAADYIMKFVVAHQGVVNSLFTLLVILVLYIIITSVLRRYLKAHAQRPENVQNFMMMWRYAWMTIAVIFALVSFSGSLASLGLSAAFLGMVLGWSLQAPVTGIAAWLMILLKRPFLIGDRIIISGITGDVSDITLTHIHLNQVGGTVGGEERSGRGVLIPNATLFAQIIHNYTIESSTLLDEVPVLITYESNLDHAEQIMLDAAREVTAEIIKDTGQEPFTRMELADSGLRVRVRFQTIATDRQRITSDIVRILFREIRAAEDVEFAYPHSEILHRPKLPPEPEPAEA